MTMRYSILVVGPLLMLSCGAWAAPERFSQKLSRMTAELKLTTEQKTQLQKIHEGNQKTVPALKTAMIDARDHLQEALSGSASESECQKRFDDLEKKQTEFGRARFQNILAVRSVLTPEQRQKFKPEDESADREAR